MPYATIFFTGNGHKSQGSLTLNWNDGGTFDTVYNVLACGDVFWATLYKRENFAIYTHSHSLSWSQVEGVGLYLQTSKEKIILFCW